MSETEMALIKPEAMKSYIWLQCADGSIQQVEEEVAMFCPVICQKINQSRMGSSKNKPISLPERVYPYVLSLILDYCRFHQVLGRSNKERKSFDEKFIKLDTKRLCELASAADSLQLKPLVDLTSQALARMIEGKTPEEIRETFHLPDDLTEEEKLEPLKNSADDPRIRLLNRLYAKKRKELMERQKLKIVEVGEAEEEQVDARSVDDLLSYINGAGGTNCAKASKTKKKNRRKKDHSSEPSKNNSSKTHKEVAICSPTSSHSSEMKESNGESFVSKVDFEDADLDDELDPAMKEELDRMCFRRNDQLADNFIWEYTSIPEYSKVWTACEEGDLIHSHNGRYMHCCAPFDKANRNCCCHMNCSPVRTPSMYSMQVFP